MATERTTTAESAQEEMGLTSGEAERRLAEDGPNDPTASHRRSLLAEILLLFLNPLAIILLIAGVISWFLGEVASACIILSVVLLGIIINFVQTYRSQRAIEDLRKSVSPTATVLRDGAWREINRRDVVRGDVVRLSAGDLVPADARLLTARDLYVQEAALTGESMPSEKDAAPAASARGAPDESTAHKVFLGTSVVSGTATALVTATGSRTAFGAIARRLASRPPETEFERGLRRFGHLIMRILFLLVLFIVVVRVAAHKDAFESLVFAVALAVGLTPEFLPMITSVTLAKGAVRMARAKVIVKRLPAIQNFGSIDVLCADKTGTLTVGEMALVEALDALGNPSEQPLLPALLNSRFETGIRSPLDTAILKTGGSNALPYTKCDEIPFDFDRRRVSIVVEKPAVDGHERTLIAKGAPGGILELSDSFMRDGETIPFNTGDREKCRKAYQELNGRGLRVLAVAHRTVDARGGFTAADEKALVLDGFLAFSDPVQQDARHALAALVRNGVQLKILTGDNELVARHVCAQVGINASRVVLGRELDSMTDAALAHVAEQASIFARVSPVQKDRIIQALKRRSHVVGYIGDGINDAPSLHAADIILVKPGLRVLHRGIIEGRKASANVMKYLLMGTSSNFGNMFSMAGASLLLPFLPMLPTQILLNNFLYDLAQITIPTDNVDPVYIRRPQRWDMSLIRNFMIFIGPISSIYDFLTFYVLLRFFHASEALFHTGWFVESLATQTLVLFIIRTMANPLRSRPSRSLAVTTVLIVAVGVLIPFSPLASFLGFTGLSAAYFAFLGGAVATYLFLVELAKRRLFSRLQA